MDAWWQNLGAWIPLETAARLLMAIAGGAVLGWERERHDKPAGLRTHMLVSLGAAAFMIGAMELSADLGDANGALHFDPTRALAAIIGGVGFLGAGSIIQSRGAVHGITTAASIWVAAAVGTSCGMGLYRLAITSGVLALLVLWIVGIAEFWFRRARHAGEDDAPEPAETNQP